MSLRMRQVLGFLTKSFALCITPYMVPTSCQVLLLVLYLDPKNSYMQPPSTVQEGSGGQTTCCDAYSLIQMMSVWLQITVV